MGKSMKHTSMRDSKPPNIDNDWVFCCKTPNGGKEFYNEKTKQLAVIYQHSVKIFTGLINSNKAQKFPFPIDFNECRYYRR